MGRMGPLGGPQGVSPIIPLFPFRVNRGLLTLSDAVRCTTSLYTAKTHGNVRSIIVLPAKAPIPGIKGNRVNRVLLTHKGNRG